MRGLGIFRDVILLAAVLGVVLVLKPADINFQGKPSHTVEMSTSASGEITEEAVSAESASSRAEVMWALAEIDRNSIEFHDNEPTEPHARDNPFVGTSMAIWESVDPPANEEPRPARPPLPLPDAEFLDQAGDDGTDEDAIRVELISKPLSAILIQGNNRIKTEKIMKSIKTAVGQIVDVNRIHDDIRALIKRRWFSTVEVRPVRSKDGPVLIFRVVERPIPE